MTTETLIADATNTTDGQALTPTDSGATGASGESQQQQATKDIADAPKADAAKDDSDTGKPQGAPEKYDFKLPEGALIDEIGVNAFSEFAKSQGLTQEAAQAQIEAMAPAMQKAQAQRMEKAKTEWLEQAKGDKEFGGDKFTENLTTADKALNQLGTPELTKLLKESGLNHHPEIIRLLFKAGKAISEDDSVVTGGNATTQQTTAQRMYPNMNP
jgi:hypothetical protein